MAGGKVTADTKKIIGKWGIPEKSFENGLLTKKILQGSSNFCKTQHVLYNLNAGGSRISNMTFQCVMKVIKVMKVMRISLHICIS